MKYRFPLIYLIVPFIKLNNAQDLADIPACATSAALTSIASTGCALQDYPCICRDSSFINSLLPIVEQACDALDLQRTIVFAQQLCASVSVTITVSGVTSAPASTSASASASIEAIITSSVTATVSVTPVTTLSSSTSRTSSTRGTSSISSIGPAQITNAASPRTFIDFFGGGPLTGVLGLVVGMMELL